MHTTPSKSTSESTAAGGWRRQLEALTTPAELPRASGREEEGEGVGGEGVGEGEDIDKCK